MKGKRENPCWHTQRASGALAVVVLLREWAPRCVVGPRGCSTLPSLPSLQPSLTSCPRDSTRAASSPPRSAMCRHLPHKLFQAANANFPPCIGSVWGEGVRLVQRAAARKAASWGWFGASRREKSYACGVRGLAVFQKSLRSSTIQAFL